MDLGYGLPIGYLPHRYGDPGYRYGIWDDDMGDDSIDTVIIHIDMGYLVTLRTSLGSLGLQALY
jgi:hypothetical protein